MRSAHQAHGLYNDCPHGAHLVIESALVFTVFTALVEQQFPAKHRIEIRHEHPYLQENRSKKMDLALLEPGTDRTPRLGACIETKLWGDNDQTLRDDVGKMRTLDPNVRKLMLLTWGLGGESSEPADWVESKARDVGLIIRHSWLHSFQAAVWTGKATFSQSGRVWLALMEAAAAA